MEFPKTCYYCCYEPIARHNGVPVCREHLPEKPPAKAPAYSSPVDEAPQTPKTGGLFGTYGTTDYDIT